MNARQMLQQLDRDIAARGITRQELCEKAGLNRGAITGWHLTNSRNQVMPGFRMSSWKKVKEALKEFPPLELPPEPAPTPQLSLNYDDVKNVEAIPQFAPPIPQVSAEAKPKTTGDDALRDVILDKLLAMDTVKLALLYAHIVNNLK